MAINDRIKEARIACNLSQQALGEKIGISRSSICKLESGENSPSEQTIILICVKLNVNRIWLESGEGEMIIVAETDDELVDSIMTGENETAKSIMRAFARAGRDDPALWDALKKVVDAIKAGH